MNFSILGGFKRCFHHILKTQVQGITSLAEDQIAFNSSGGFVLKNIEVKPKVRYHSVSFRLSFPFLGAYKHLFWLSRIKKSHLNFIHIAVLGLNVKKETLLCLKWCKQNPAVLGDLLAQGSNLGHLIRKTYYYQFYIHLLL